MSLLTDDALNAGFDAYNGFLARIWASRRSWKTNWTMRNPVLTPLPFSHWCNTTHGGPGQP